MTDIISNDEEFNFEEAMNRPSKKYIPEESKRRCNSCKQH